jgi:shikimate dehydrogenase
MARLDRPAFAGRVAGIALGDPALGRELAAADLLVSSVPPASGVPEGLDLGALRAETRVADLAYHPAEPPVVAAARARGLRAWNGLGMLVHQGAASFRLWTGRAAPLDAMAAAAGYRAPRRG